MDELKACPFCGSTDIDTMGFGGGDRPDINFNGHTCRACGAAPGDVGLDAWQSRPIEDALRAEVEVRGDQVSALMEQVAHYMAEAQDLRAENASLKAELERYTADLTNDQCDAVGRAMRVASRENMRKWDAAIRQVRGSQKP